MLKKGDKVKIVKKILVWKTGGNDNSWVDAMDDYIGKTVIINYCDDYEFSIVELARGLCYPVDCAVLINKIKNKLK